MVDFHRLSSAWIEFNNLGHVHGSAVTDCADCQISFISDAQSFHLHQHADWWIIDEVDDRLKR